MNSAVLFSSAAPAQAELRTAKPSEVDGGFAQVLDKHVRAQAAPQPRASDSAESDSEPTPLTSADGDQPQAKTVARRDHGPMQVSQEVRPEPGISTEETEGQVMLPPLVQPTVAPVDESQVKGEVKASSETASEGAPSEVVGPLGNTQVVPSEAGAVDEGVSAVIVAKAKATAGHLESTLVSSPESKPQETKVKDEAEAEVSAETPGFELEAEPSATGAGPAPKAAGPLGGAEFVRHMGAPQEAPTVAARSEVAAPARASGWSTEVIQQLQDSQQMSQLKDGRLRLQLNEGSQRMTVVLQEKDGVVSLSASVNNKTMADAMLARMDELRAGLAQQGLSLGDMQTHTQDEQGGDGEEHAGDGASEAPELRGDAGPVLPLPWMTRRLVV